MEKPVIFLQSLLVLAVTIQIISACKCDTPNTFLESMCANQTLVMATALSYQLYDVADNQVDDSSKAARAEYYMHLNTVYQKGQNPFDEENYFILITTIDEMECGVVLEVDKVYFIAGTAGTGHALHVNSCDFLESVSWTEFSKYDSQIKDLLNQQLVC